MRADHAAEKLNTAESLSAAQLLQFARENGMIDLTHIEDAYNMQRRKELLDKHPYKIWQDKDNIWHTYLPDAQKKRVHKKRNSEKEIQDIVIEYWAEQEYNPTMQEVFDECMSRRVELGKISRATLMINKQIFDKHYADWKKKRIKNISEEMLIDFLEEQIAKYDLTAKAFSNLKSITRQIFKRARARKLVNFQIDNVYNELDVSEKQFRKNIKEDYQEVFMEDELPVMIDYLVKNADIWNLGILIMLVTGIRVGELVTLQYTDFEKYDDFYSIKIRRTETRYCDENGKRVYGIKDFPKSEAGVRCVVIPKQFSWIYDSLRKINPFGEYVFMVKGKRLTTNAIRQRMYGVCEKLPVYKKSPHKARKTFATILLDNKIDRQFIKGQMGHTDILCTENFYHRNRRSMERKAEILSQIGEFDTLGIKRYQTGS